VDKGLKPSTINDKTMKVLRMLFHQAFVDEVIPQNPTLGVKRLAQGVTDVDSTPLPSRSGKRSSRECGATSLSLSIM
jgi:hypothetical protein